MMVCASAISPPPPEPCTARPAISTLIDGASAQISEPATKMPMAISIMARRPWMSDSLPNSGVTAVAVKRYAVTTQDRSARLAKRRPMVGSAVATMVWSSAPRNIASMMPSTMLRTSGWVSARVWWSVDVHGA